MACCSTLFEGLRVTVLGLERGWTFPDSLLPPDSVIAPAPGAEFVTVELGVENVTGSGARSFNAAEFQLASGDQSRWLPGPALRQPALRFGQVFANVPRSGWVTFELPTGTALTHLVWSPDLDLSFEIRLDGL